MESAELPILPRSCQFICQLIPKMEEHNPNSPEEQLSSNMVVLMFLGGLGLLLFLMRINRIAFFIALALLLIGSLVVYLIRRIRQRKQQVEFARSSEGVIHTQIMACEEHINKLGLEMNDIRQNLKELKDELGQSASLHAKAREESEKLIGAFNNELKLRKVKLEFYENCKQKLQTLLSNHHLLQSLENKQQKLKRLQESRYEQLADMESLKSNLEYEQRYLETIESLSLRMLDSQSTDTAQALQLELSQLTRELRKL